jgi:predicted nucleic acid-binding protein
MILVADCSSLGVLLIAKEKGLIVEVAPLLQQI